MQHCLLCEKEIVLPTTWFHLVTCPSVDVCCQECRALFEVVSGETCYMCHRPFVGMPTQYRQGDRCYDCIRWETDSNWSGLLQMNRSVYTYNKRMKEVLATCKFRGDIALLRIFEQAFQQTYQRYFSHIDLFVPIPLSAERLYERGFNQAAVLATYVSTNIEELLCRVHTEKQSKKSRTERIHVENVFRYNKSSRLTGQNILLIDDIYTTGSTLRHAAMVLREHGAGKISTLTLVRG
jgi:competence protein ComFC